MFLKNIVTYFPRLKSRIYISSLQKKTCVQEVVVGVTALLHMLHVCIVRPNSPVNCFLAIVIDCFVYKGVSRPIRGVSQEAVLFQRVFYTVQ